MKIKRENEAVSETVATLLILVIAVSLFSLVYASILTISPPSQAPSANIAFGVNGNIITVDNYGGEPLSINTKIVITTDDGKIVKTIADGLDGQSKSDGLWGIGESAVFQVGDLPGKQITINVIDSDSNSIVTSGVVYKSNIVQKPELFTYVYEINPYVQTKSPIIITASADNRLDNITLWYRYSSDNSSWGGYLLFGTDNSPPWSWSFNFPNETGYYGFCTIGSYDNKIEEIPDIMDTVCLYTHAPEIYNPVPANSSTDVSVNPTIGITVDDIEDRLLTVIWYSNSSGSWVRFATNYSVDTSNGPVTLHQTNNNFSNYGQTYNWYVDVDNGIVTNSSPYFCFTTQSQINTWVNTVDPYDVTFSPLSVTATGSNELNNITLWYRCSVETWDTLTYDDFESGWGNYTDGGRDCHLYTGGDYAYQGNAAADIQDNSGLY
ncbi:MAG TPA: type IV pilin, partial [Thermoplasmatales archaeon]|nr:type IV pilin [Thermoplasmatales archaeon]